jgi:hypothetical protein
MYTRLSLNRNGWNEIVLKLVKGVTKRWIHNRDRYTATHVKCKHEAPISGPIVILGTDSHYLQRFGQSFERL